jgi:hypothetical protein
VCFRASRVCGCHEAIIAERLDIFFAFGDKHDRRFKHFAKPVEDLTLSFFVNPSAVTIGPSLIEALRFSPYYLVEDAAAFVGIGVFRDSAPLRWRGFAGGLPEPLLPECRNYVALLASRMAFHKDASVSCLVQTERGVVIVVRWA